MTCAIACTTVLARADTSQHQIPFVYSLAHGLVEKLPFRLWHVWMERDEEYGCLKMTVWFLGAQYG